MTDKISGGCLCGSIRYETISDPLFQILCHCTDCQKISGAAGYAAYVVPIDTIVVTKGEPTIFDVQADSGRTNSRRFCPHCGTRVWAQLDEQGLASVNGLSLDIQDHFRPAALHLPLNAPSWCKLDDNLGVV